jgi:YD repeat-containing protein
LVTVTETAASSTSKVTKYHYDTLGRLRERRVKDVSPIGATDRELIWKYAYVKSGALGYMSEPSGKTTHMYYDDRGNLIKSLVFATDVENPNTQTDIEVTASTPVTELLAGQTIQIASFVQNDPTGKGVTYLAASGEITPEGLYTAPTSIPMDVNTSIVVTSKLDPANQRVW